MRILAISNHATMVGGGEYSFINLVSNLPLAWQVLAAAPLEGELPSALSEKKIKTLIIPLPAIRPSNMINLLGSLYEYIKLCRKYQPNLIYANGSRAAFYGGLAGRIMNIPSIWHCRISASDIIFDRILCRLNTRIIANSQATMKRFKPKIRKKVNIVYNGVDLEWLRMDSLKKPELIGSSWKVILIVARASREKRHDLTLHAFETLAESDPDIHLVCLGSIDEHDLSWWRFLQERTSRSSYSDRIHWVGQVEDVRPWYHSASMLFLSSEEESFGRVLVEAMACSVPVVATRVGGVPEIVRQGHDGLLVSSGNVDEMAIAMKTLLHDNVLRRQLVLSARKRAEYFSIDRHITNMLKTFEKALRVK
ncbi:glycosyltransferase [Thermodesulfobacteriota bacterium]